MRLSIQPARGVVPRLAPQLLPMENAQIAQNARLLSGDLEAWQDVDFVSQLYKSGTINTIHLMARQYWLHWTTSELAAGAVEVDVTRGPIAGDEDERTYFTGTDAPRVTDIAMAIGSCGMQYPCDSLLLGVPAPTQAPVLIVDAGTPDESNVTIDNPGAELGNISGWIVDDGDLDVHDAAAVADMAPHSGNYYFFGGAAAAETEAHQSRILADDSLFPQQKLELKWWQASGDNGSKAAMKLEFYNGSAALIGEVDVPVEAVTPAKTWTQRTVSGQIPLEAVSYRIVMIMERVGAGENDAFIDDITLSATDYEQSFDCSDFDGWTKGPEAGVTAVIVDATIGRPAPSWRFTQNNSVSYVYKNIGMATSPKARIEADVYAIENINLMLYATEDGYGIAINIGVNGCRLMRYTSWADQHGTVLATLAAGVGGLWCGVTADVNTISPTTADLTLTVTKLEAGEVVVDAHEAEIEVNGSYVGFKSRSNETSERSWVDNVSLSVVAPEPDNTDEIVFTNYLVAYCNQWGEIGPPSPVSRSIQRSNNAPVEVQTQTAAPSGYGITHKVIFRAATGSSGSAYLTVAKIPLEQESYTDNLADFDLGVPLESQLADLPPADMRGLLAMPNRILVGFAKNELILSEQGRYYSFPVDYRQATDYPIIAIGAIDASIIVLTESYPYVATGYTPDAISMRKMEVAYACSSKRSVANLKDFGIVYASPDGLVAINGQGAPILLTSGLLNREQWQDLNPESILGVAHDDRYYGFYDKGDGEKGGFILDARQDGFGLVFIDVWAQSAYSDALTDRLYLVIGDDIWAWGESTYKLPYVWRSKLFKLPRPTSFAAAQIRAADYDDLTLHLLADGVEILNRTILSETEFVLPAKLARYTLEIELRGTSRVQMVQLAEEMDELE